LTVRFAVRFTMRLTMLFVAEYDRRSAR
jgi:hypothetical protein